MINYGEFLHDAKNTIIRRRIGYILMYAAMFVVSFVISFALISNSKVSHAGRELAEQKRQISEKYEQQLEKSKEEITYLNGKIDELAKENEALKNGGSSAEE